MANLTAVDAQGNLKFIKVTGAGTDNDPYVVVHTDTDVLSSIGSSSDPAASFDAYGNLSDASILQILKSIAFKLYNGMFDINSKHIENGLINSADTTSQVLFKGNGRRIGIIIQNLSSNDIWIDFGTNATTASPSIKIKPDSILELSDSKLTTVAIFVVGTVANQSLTAKEISIY